MQIKPHHGPNAVPVVVRVRNNMHKFIMWEMRAGETLISEKREIIMVNDRHSYIVAFLSARRASRKGKGEGEEGT